MKKPFYVFTSIAAMGIGALCFGTVLGRVWLVQSERLEALEKNPDLSKLFHDLDFWLRAFELLLGIGIGLAGLLVGALLLRDTVRNPEQGLFELTFLAFPGALVVYGLCGTVIWAQTNFVVAAFYAVMSLPLLVSLLRFYLPWIKNGPPRSS